MRQKRRPLAVADRPGDSVLLAAREVEVANALLEVLAHSAAMPIATRLTSDQDRIAW